MEMEQEVATTLNPLMGVATMEEETLPIGDSRCVPGKSSLPSHLPIKDKDDFGHPLLPSSRNGESGGQRIGGEAISSIGFKKSPVENTCCEEGKSSEGEAVGDPAPFGSVGKRGLPQPPSWADRVAGRGSAPEEDLPPLKVILGEGQPRIVVTEEDLLSMTKPFQWSAVCCFMGSTSKVSGNISKLISGLLTQWMGRISPQISLLNKGDFLIQVTTEEELNLVLKKRVWKVSGRVLVAARWSLGQPLEINPSTTAPLWVRLPGLPPYFWNGRIFKAVAMGLQGDFLEADTPTVQMSRTNFARILLDLPIQSELPPEVEIDLGGGHILAQATVYEGRLWFCHMCGVNTHPPEKCPKMLNSKVKDDSRTLEAGHMVTGSSLNKGNGPSNGSRLKHLTATNRFEVLAETEEDQGPHDKTKEWPEKLPKKSEQEGSAPVHAPRGKRGKSILSNSVKDQDNNHISTKSLPNPFDSKPLDVPDFPCDVPPGFFFSSSSQSGQDGVASFSSKLGAIEGSSSQTFRLSRDAKHISRGRGSRGSKGRNIVKDTSNFNLLLHEDFEGVGSKRRNQLKVVSRSSSDHSPLVFSSSFSDFGHTRPKLFRFFSSWARLPESHRIVAEAWSRSDLGCPLIRVTSKLERVRKDLSRWYKHQVGDVALRINGLKQSLENIQIRCEAGDSSAAPVEMLLRQELSTTLLEEESQWRQKAKIKWLREGDGNTTFFQRVVKGRRVKNQILTMEDGGLEYEDQDMIQQICFNYFSSLLGTTDGSDDVLLFSDTSHASIEQVQETLRLLVTNAGLKVNSQKSNIYFSDAVSVEAKDRICATLGWPCDALPTSYLGLPLFADKLKDVWCQPLINKVEKRLSLWKSATLSYAGRLCLLKHVLSSVSGFWTSIFTLPKKVSRLLAASMANFLWGGDENSKARHLIAWDQVCKPYSEGGNAVWHIGRGEISYWYGKWGGHVLADALLQEELSFLQESRTMTIQQILESDFFLVPQFGAVLCRLHMPKPQLGSGLDVLHYDGRPALEAKEMEILA
ncbi:putative ribonuclease H protein [Nymphaea thermarum]|nr:putative ribonuclease H protein [Nymphaea thermarum]